MDYIPENESDKSKEESFCLQNRVGQKMKQTIVIKGNKLTSNIDSINEQNIQNSMGQNN